VLDQFSVTFKGISSVFESDFDEATLFHHDVKGKLSFFGQEIGSGSQMMKVGRIPFDDGTSHPC
jgi:hypothetical protein